MKPALLCLVLFGCASIERASDRIAELAIEAKTTTAAITEAAHSAKKLAETVRESGEGFLGLVKWITSNPMEGTGSLAVGAAVLLGLIRQWSRRKKVERATESVLLAIEGMPDAGAIKQRVLQNQKSGDERRIIRQIKRRALNHAHR